MGRLVIVCGLPGAGKSTLAREREAELRAVRLSADDWLVDLGIDVFDGAARERVEQLQRRLSDRLLGLGQRVIVEWGTWSRAERDELREGARRLGAAVEVHMVDAPVEVLWERVRTRGFEQRHGGRALTRQDLEAYAAVFERPDDAELALYDPPLHVSRRAAPLDMIPPPAGPRLS